LETIMPGPNSVPPADPIPGQNNNPNPDQPGRWKKPGTQDSGSDGDFPPPVSGDFLPGKPNPSPGSGGELDRNAIVASSEDYITHVNNEIVRNTIIAGVVLTAVVTLPITVPLVTALLGTLTVATAATAALVGTGVILGSGWFQAANAQQPIGDPILLDLNGDGIKTTDFTHGTFFDQDNNGFAEWSTWVDPNDGILVADLNHNGIIDNGTELFGDHTVLANGSNAHDGYAALQAYDSNSDGVVNSLDQNFSQLEVLKGDGTLLSLQQAGVQSFSLSGTVGTRVDENGNVQTMFGSYLKTDNTVAQFGDFNLLTNTAISNPETYVAVSSAIDALPDAIGSGNLYTLQQAMAMDSSNLLKGLVEGFVSATDESTRNSLLEQIIAKWSGVPLTNATTIGGMLLATHLAVVEKFEGQTFNNGNLNFLSTVAAGSISQEYEQLSENLYGKLMAQSQLQDYFAEIKWAQDASTSQYSLNLESVENKIETLYATDEASAIQVAAQFSRALVGLNWASVSNYAEFYTSLVDLDPDFKFALDSAGKAVVTGTSSGDLLGSYGVGAWDDGTGQSSRDSRPYYLNGGAGNDTLQGSYGADVLTGGQGNDTLTGYDGNDSYIFNLGDGQDTIIEGNAFAESLSNFHPVTDDRISTGYDSIFFGAGIAATDLSYSMSGDYFNISINGTTDQISILTKSMDYLVEQLVFHNGTVVKTADILHTYLLEGTAGDDLSLTPQGIFHDIGQYVKAYAGDDRINTGFSDDTVEGGDGNDQISDRGGDNYLDGGAGIDAIYSGDGYDTLLGGDGDDGLYAGNGNNSVDGGAGNDSVTAGSGIDSLTGGGGNDTIDAGDGSDNVNGDDGNDSLLGGNGSDILSGGAGNDTLKGGNGNDTYLFNTGFGQVTVDETTGSGTDTLSFATGLAASNAIFGTNGNGNLTVSLTNSPSSQVTVMGAINNNGIENYHFSDTDLTTSQIMSQLQVWGGSNNDYIQGSNYGESLFGFAGNDTLDGYDGNDTLDGGSGNDSLLGGNGNDSYSLVAGFAVDKIDESASDGNDSISFGSGLNASDAIFSGYAANTLRVQFSGSATDDLYVVGQLANNSVEIFHFADGTDLTASQVFSKLQVVGTADDDYLGGSNYAESITGFAGNDQLFAYDGNDTIRGGDGNDTIDAGWGNDSIYGDNGNDSLIGNNGDDQLNGGSGADILLAGVGDDALLGGDGNDYLSGDDGNDSLAGDAGSDNLHGSAGDDTLTGGTGDDYLYGEAGNDTFLYAAGDGTDNMTDTSAGSNTLLLGSGITQSSIALFQDGYGQLQIGFTNNNDDLITINSTSAMSQIELSDGPYLTVADVNQIIQDMASYASTNSASFSSLSDVENNSNLLAIVNSGWHH
jgi:Ca2+-binding RTX toxin-like protein